MFFTTIKHDHNTYLLPSYSWVIGISSCKNGVEAGQALNKCKVSAQWLLWHPTLFFYFRIQDYPLITSKLEREATFTPDPPVALWCQRPGRAAAQRSSSRQDSSTTDSWWCKARKVPCGAFSSLYVLSKGRAVLSSQEIEDIFHTLDRAVSQSWDVRDRGV